MSGDKYIILYLSSPFQEFDDKFEDKFKLKSKGYSKGHIEFSKNTFRYMHMMISFTLSNMTSIRTQLKWFSTIIVNVMMF